MKHEILELYVKFEESTHCPGRTIGLSVFREEDLQ
jgi:hypothetical protein